MWKVYMKCIQVFIKLVCVFFSFFQAVEPMQVDGAPEENDNVEEEPQYTVENPSLVCLY